MGKTGHIARRKVAAHFPPLVVQELQTLETSLGGRTAIVGMLSLAPLSQDLRYVLGLLGHPDHAAKSLAEIWAMGQILPGTLLQELAGAALLKGKIQASQKIGDGIAAVAEDVMRRAAPFEEACHACRGTGSHVPEPTPTQPNPSPQPCEPCVRRMATRRPRSRRRSASR